jgi:hypothetical protein
VSPGFGSAGALIDMIKADHSGATAEAIEYPACGGQSSCGGVQYGDSARQGTEAVATAVNDFHSRCPDSQIVLVGYSQVCYHVSSLTLQSAHHAILRAATSCTTPSVEEEILEPVSLTRLFLSQPVQ